MREYCKLIERTVVTKENRFVIRVIRSLFALRKRINSDNLKKIIVGFYTHSTKERDALLAYVPEDDASGTAMDTDSSAPPTRLRGAKSALTPLLPEVDVFLHLVVLLYLLDNPKVKAETAVNCADALMKKVVAQNRRSLDHLAARSYYYFIRSYENAGKIASVRGFLHSRLRTSTLRNDFEGQAVLINCLLRSYVNHNLYDQADKLVNKTTFPENASNNEWARYMYYLGRIKAIQLEYSEAHKHLVQSLRKAPQYSAAGFKHTVLKLSITVELLLGNIPERQTFLQPNNKKALTPYLQLTQGDITSFILHYCSLTLSFVFFSLAVRSGDVKKFQEVLDNFAPQFKEDHTFTLILRLHVNVIKTAIRTISLAYSRISLTDVAKKLGLESSEDAEYIIAKVKHSYLLQFREPKFTLLFID